MYVLLRSYTILMSTNNVLLWDERVLHLDILNWLENVKSAIGRLHRRGWTKQSQNRDQDVYTAVLLKTFLFGSESWVTYRSHIHLIEGFHRRCLRSIHFVTNMDALKTAKVPSIKSTLIKTQLRWTGYVFWTKNIVCQKLYYTASYYMANVTEMSPGSVIKAA